MKDQLVSYSVAKLAKKHGFVHMKPNCFGDNMAYNSNGELICAHKGNTVSGYILAPTQSLLQKWFRENHNLIIEVWFNNGNNKWAVGLYIKGKKSLSQIKALQHPTFEAALEYGLLESFQELT